MPATNDLDPGLIPERGLHPSMPARNARQCGDGIELPQPGRAVEQVLAGGGNATAEFAEECLLTGDHGALRVEDEGFLLLQLGRDVTLAIDQRLLAHVLGGDRLAVGMTDLDVVPEHLVEANLERPDAASLALMLLQRTDPLARGARAVADAVQLRIEPGTEDAAIFERCRHLLDQGRCEGRL